MTHGEYVCNQTRGTESLLASRGCASSSRLLPVLSLLTLSLPINHPRVTTVCRCLRLASICACCSSDSHQLPQAVCVCMPVRLFKVSLFFCKTLSLPSDLPRSTPVCVGVAAGDGLSRCFFLLLFWLAASQRAPSTLVPKVSSGEAGCVELFSHFL